MSKLKARLNEYKWIQENVNNLEDRLLEIDTKLQKITNTLQQDIVQTSKDNDKWTSLIQKRIETQELINIKMTSGLEEMIKIENMIEGLSEREKLLMRLRYIGCYKWEEICVKMSLEWAQTHRTHAEALNKLSKTKHDTK